MKIENSPVGADESKDLKDVRAWPTDEFEQGQRR
jgi:hypothetical protein